MTMIDNSSKSSSDKILYLLKTEGAKTAAEVAKALKITSMGARQHLQNLTDDGFIEFKDIKQGRGRPARYWEITEAADAKFPNKHSELTLQLMNAVKDVYGDDGISEIIHSRQNQSLARYQEHIKDASSLFGKLQLLAEIRTEEGYMADVEQRDDGYVLNENHCPICIAAASNEKFCRSELELFRNILGDDYVVERNEHILSKERRCSYFITEQK